MKRLRWRVAAMLVGVALGAAQASAQNLLDNPGFELPFAADGAPFDDNWEAFSGGAGASSGQSSAMPRSGASHLDLSIVNVDNTFAGVFQDVPGLAPGQPVTFSGWHKTISNPLDMDVEIRIEWRNAAGDAEISRTPNFTPIPTMDYSPFSLSANVPAGAAIARVVYAVQTFSGGASNTGTIFVDDASVSIPEPGSVALIGAGAIGLLTATRRRKSA